MFVTLNIQQVDAFSRTPNARALRCCVAMHRSNATLGLLWATCLMLYANKIVNNEMIYCSYLFKEFHVSREKSGFIIA